MTAKLNSAADTVNKISTISAAGAEVRFTGDGTMKLEGSDTLATVKNLLVKSGTLQVKSTGVSATKTPVINVLGADLMDGTPIFAIKPYVTYADSIPDAQSGFVDAVDFRKVSVVFPKELTIVFNAEQLQALTQVLENDPRPSYQTDAEKVYGMPFAGFDVRFKVKDSVLTVVEVE